MNTSAAAEVSGPSFKATRLWPWLAVAVLLLFVGLIRFRLLEVPLERDEGEYAYAGQLILQGIPPYELAYNMKLPGTYFAYAAGMAIFGQSVAGIHLLLLAANSLACVFVFVLGRRLSGPVAGLAACASYALMSLNPAVFGLAAHATQFMALCAVAGALLLWNGLASGRRLTLFSSGLMFGLAFMMKQPGLCFGLFGGAMMIWQAVQNRSVLSRALLHKLLAFGLGLSLPFGVFCLAALAYGDFSRFWFWTFDYAAHYATRVTPIQGLGLLADYLRDNYSACIGFWVMAAIGLLAFARAPEKRRELLFTLAFLGFSFLGTASGLYFRGHYFVLVLPAFALLIGLGVERWQAFLSARRMPWLPPVVLAIVLALGVYQERFVYFQLTPREICAVFYNGNPFLESLPIAQYIHDHSNANARVAVIGSEPQIYFYARRHSATGYIYTYALMEPQPYALTMQRDMIREIEAAKPEFLVLVTYEYSWLRRPDSNLAIFEWLGPFTRQFYAPIAIAGHRADGQFVMASGPEMAKATDLSESITLFQRLQSQTNAPASSP